MVIPLATLALAKVSSTTIYVRLAATITVGTYSGNVVVSGGGATSQNVATASSTVGTATLTITGLTGSDKPYDQTTTAAFTGTPAYSGLVNGESFSVTGTASANFVTAAAGNGINITVTGYTAPSANYTVTQPTLSANITKLTLTVTGATVTSKPFDGTFAASITGETLVGVLSPDVVTVSGGGTFADTNAANGIAVTAALSLGGAAVGNYTLTQPTGLTGNITQASQTITFGALATKTTASADFTLGATASSGLTVSYASSDPTVATVSGNTVHIVGIGATTITASQAGNGNYSAATSVPQTLTVTAPPTVLAPGDLAIIAVGPSNPDKFAFVLLKAITAGTVINFTDNGFASATTGTTTEGFEVYTAPTDLPAGSVVTFVSGTTTTGWSSSGSFSLNASGEQLFAFQGPTAHWADQVGVTVLYGVGSKQTWITTGSTTASTSYAPSTSILPSAYLVEFTANSDVYLTTTTMTDTAANILAAVTTPTSANYNLGSAAFTMPAYTTFTILAPQTITFGTLADKTYGDAAFTLGATASSGLTVSYASSAPGVATVSGNTVTITGVGTTTITASQAGDGTTYGAAPSVPQTLTVVASTITASDLVMGARSGVPATMHIIGGKRPPTDSNGNALSVSAVSYTGGNGGGVTTDGTSVTYTAASGYTGSDTFTYTVSNASGAGSATATVTVTVVADSAGFNQLSVAGNVITYAGIPGFNYALDNTPSLTPPVVWTPVVTNTATANGSIQFTTSGSGFYRTRCVP